MLSRPDDSHCLQLIDQLVKHSAQITCAESCTGGLLAAALTEHAGASQWFQGGLVAYSQACKTSWLSVPALLVQTQGMVSEPVALSMANGCLTRCLSLASPVPPTTLLSIGITGIAGPSSDELNNPVGKVCFGFVGSSTQYPHLTFSRAQTQIFAGDRSTIRIQAVDFAIKQILQMLS